MQRAREMVDNTRNRRQPDLIIPVGLSKYKGLTWLDKVLLAEITSLDGPDGCYASNEYLADFLGTNPRSVSRTVSRLVELGFITLHWKAHPFKLAKQRILHSRLAERLVELQREEHEKTLDGCNPPTRATLGVCGDDTLGACGHATLVVHSNSSEKGDSSKEGTTGQALRAARSDGGRFTTPASEGLTSYQLAKAIGEELGITISTKNATAKVEVLNDWATLHNLLQVLYKHFGRYTPQSLNQEISEAIGWLVRNRKKKIREDQLLFLVEWLCNQQQRPDTTLVIRDSNAPAFSEISQSDFAYDMVNVWKSFADKK